MLCFKLVFKLLLLSLASLLLLACAQKTELQKAESVAVLFYQSLNQKDQEKAITIIGIPTLEEDISKNEQEIIDVKIKYMLQEIAEEMIKEIHDNHQGLKKITVINSKFTNNEETQAEVKIKLEFNDNENIEDNVQLFKQDNKWLIILGGFHNS